MREREMELIAGLAEGTLDDETEARALVASSDEARREYEAQVSAIEALRGLEPATMTDAERAALHRDLWTQLRSEAAPSRRSGNPWYMRWVSVAAALFVVMGLAAVLTQSGLMGTGDESADLGQAAAELRSDGEGADTTAADSAGGDDSATGLSDEDEAAGGDRAAAPETMALDPEELGRLADLVRSGDIEESDRLQLDSAEEQGEAIECIRNAGLGQHRVIARADTGHLLVVPEGEPVADATPVTFVDAESCEIVYVDG